MLLPILAAVLASAKPAINASNSLPKRGVATWVYDSKGGQPGMWAEQISTFNKVASVPISIVYSYGGDMEYYKDLIPPYKTYFPAQSQKATEIYANTTGVEYIVAVIDGRMDGHQSYSPDMSKLSVSQAEAWADVTADVYCSYQQINGLQIDLEPFTAPYADHLIAFLARLSMNLRSKERACVSDAHPDGRSLSAFLFAEAATPAVWTALGPNGYATISGYDLSAAPAGTVSTVDYYSSQLGKVIDNITASAAANGGKFMLGVPAAASCHEFGNFTKADGTVVRGFPQVQYMERVFGWACNKKLATNPAYLGLSYWGFSSEMSYPPHSQNVFQPGTPFVEADEHAFLIRLHDEKPQCLV